MPETVATKTIPEPSLAGLEETVQGCRLPEAAMDGRDTVRKFTSNYLSENPH